MEQLDFYFIFKHFCNIFLIDFLLKLPGDPNNSIHVFYKNFFSKFDQKKFHKIIDV